MVSQPASDHCYWHGHDHDQCAPRQISVWPDCCFSSLCRCSCINRLKQVGASLTMKLPKDERADRRGTNRFHEREGYYPEIVGSRLRGICYSSNSRSFWPGKNGVMRVEANYYRLAAFYREFFSAPVSLHRLCIRWGTAIGSLACESRLAEMKEKYYSPMEDPARCSPRYPRLCQKLEWTCQRRKFNRYWVAQQLSRQLVTRWRLLSVWDTNRNLDVAFPGWRNRRDLYRRMSIFLMWTGYGKTRLAARWSPFLCGCTGEIVVLTPCQPGGENFRTVVPPKPLPDRDLFIG